MTDLQALVPGKVASPKRRPPYFSVETAPMADWQLNLRVRGDNFLKVTSPIFRGGISAHVKVEGKLKEPVALGDVRINDGLVQFPFANLKVQQGMVSLTSEDPYRPKLFIVAGSRVFGYDVRMETTGPADDPIIQFSSTPGLTSEQIVLMLTAGELPKNELDFSRRQKVTRLGLFLGKSVLSKFGGREGAGDRLMIRSGERISQAGKQTYAIEYKMSEKWSLIGEYTRFDELTAGVKWRLYSR